MRVCMYRCTSFFTHLALFLHILVSFHLCRSLFTCCVSLQRSVHACMHLYMYVQASTFVNRRSTGLSSRSLHKYTSFFIHIALVSHLLVSFHLCRSLLHESKNVHTSTFVKRRSTSLSSRKLSHSPPRIPPPPPSSDMGSSAAPGGTCKIEFARGVGTICGI